MRVSHLSLKDFRNYSEAEVDFSPGANVIVGRNGQGKTNLVESIAYFSRLGSHRVTADSALIRANAEAAVARMRIGVGERSALLEVQINRHRANRAQVNRNGVKPPELMRWFSAVVFAPEDLWIIRGEPAQRRRFVDDAIALRNPAFVGVLTDYERVLRQRNSLLKTARQASNRSALLQTLEIWDAQLIEYGSRIMLARRRMLDDLGSPLAAAYSSLVDADHRPRITMLESAISTSDDADVSRETSFGQRLSEGGAVRPSASPGSSERFRDEAEDVSRETVAGGFASALERVRNQEIDRGLTLIGPHRDDLLLELNDLPVKGYASHGETWSFALSLRLAIARLLRDESPAGDPVIILDDVFAELDRHRRERLFRAVLDFEQVIVTAAVPEDIPAGTPAHRIEIEAGRVVDDSRATVSGAAEPVDFQPEFVQGERSSEALRAFERIQGSVPSPNEAEPEPS